MNHKSSLYPKEPHWIQVLFQHRDMEASKQALSWLDESESITKRLRVAYGLINVQLLANGWQCAFRSEHQLLNIAFKQHSLIREVVLFSGEQPLVLARTVIPFSSYQAQPKLTKLGARPLGEVIFSDPNLQRSKIEFCRVEPTQWRGDILEQYVPEQTIYGRRTVYVMQQQPLLVAEFFLPALFSL